MSKSHDASFQSSASPHPALGQTAKRVLFGAIALPVLVGLIMLGPLSVQFIAMLAMLVALTEYGRLIVPHPGTNRLITWLILWVSGLMIYVGTLASESATHSGMMTACLIMLIIIGMLWRGRFKDTAHHLGPILLGLVWIPYLIVYIGLIADLENGTAWISVMLAMSFVGDTGAFTCGKLLGGRFYKNRPTPNISANKTWEGYIGAVCCVVGAMFIAQIWIPRIGDLNPIIVGVSGALLGITGDLFASAVKRSYRAKDMGTILPGHGGVLDRLDSILLIAPYVYFIAV